MHIIWLFFDWLMYLLCGIACDVWKHEDLCFPCYSRNNCCVIGGLSSIGVNVLIKLMFDTWMVSTKVLELAGLAEYA